MLGLLDCNNFFVSCERALDSTLNGIPVVVLSNNDGCVISRSNEAKGLGIPMGAPAFMYKDLFEKNGVIVLSAKFELYNSLSTQIMRKVCDRVPDNEIYSIDEVFLDFSGFRYFNLTDYCLSLKEEILREFQIPVSIGIAPTKTLCKVASRLAKKHPEYSGIYRLDTPEKIDSALQNLKIEDVWGIGRRLAAKMVDHGIYYCTDLFRVPEIWLRKQMGIHGIRMINELKGIRQIEFQEAQPKKSIATTRSFMEMIADKNALHERVETFAMYCAEKLRRQRSCCKTITVFIQTNRFRSDLPTYQNAASLQLANPSSSTIVLCREASKLFEQIYAEGFHYKKAGVIVSNFVPEDQRIASLFEPDVQDRHQPIMKAMDQLNRKYGKDKIRIGGTSGKNIYGRSILSEEYQKFLSNNILEDSNFRFH